MRLVAAFVFLAITGLLQAQSLSPNSGKFYAVIFDVTVNSSGVVDTLKVAKVIDPSSGTTNAVQIKVPVSYVSAARSALMTHKYDPDPKHFSTYFFYDPARPTHADRDPRSGHP
jgi:hypothetical protein